MHIYIYIYIYIYIRYKFYCKIMSLFLIVLCSMVPYKTVCQICLVNSLFACRFVRCKKILFSMNGQLLLASLSVSDALSYSLLMYFQGRSTGVPGCAGATHSGSWHT